jgi:hypothetical protein
LNTANSPSNTIDSKSKPEDKFEQRRLKPTDAKTAAAPIDLQDESESERIRREEQEDYSKQFLQKEAARKTEVITQTLANENACRKALAATDYESHRRRVPDAVPGTCQWLLHHEKYTRWRQKEQSGLLWLSADPGCGKSVLVSYLIDHLRDSTNKMRVPEIVCFFFFKEDNDEQGDACHAFSAILSQLYTAQPWLTQHASEVFSVQGTTMLYQFSTLWDIFMASVRDTRSRDVIIVLDGLDECEEGTRHQVLQSLTRFYASNIESLEEPPFIKTIVASRPNNDIKIAFDILPTIRLRGEDQPEAISNDIELVIDHHIHKAVHRGLPMSILTDVQAALIKGADRTFLWTTLVIELLEAKRGASKRELLEILKSRDIYRIYDRLLVDSSDPVEARKLLKVIVAAARPMTLTELSVAMAINQTQQDFDDLELDIIHNFEERIKSLCGNFVRIIYSTVYLVHQTARDFLLEDKDSEMKVGTAIGAWQHSIALWQAHSEFLDICLQYLALLNTRRKATLEEDDLSETDPHDFLDYAGRFWTRHYQGAEEHASQGQLSACRRICNPHTRGLGLWFASAAGYVHHGKPLLRDGTAVRDIASCLKLNKVVALIDQLMPPHIFEAEDEENECLEGKTAATLYDLVIRGVYPDIWSSCPWIPSRAEKVAGSRWYCTSAHHHTRLHGDVSINGSIFSRR